MFNNPIVKIFLGLLAVAAILALIELFGGDVFRIFELVWEWIVSLVNRIKDFFIGNESFRRIARGPNG